MNPNDLHPRIQLFLESLKKHPVFTNSLLVLISVTFVLACFEIGYRFYISYFHPDIAKIIKQFTWETANEKTRQRFIPHPYLSYAPSRIQYKEGGIQIEEDFFAFKKPPATLRIACLGASTTMGQYPQYIEDFLSPMLPDSIHYEVMDFGCDGWTLTESTINYMIRIQDVQPDFVIVHHGMNDMAGRIWPDFKPDYTHYRKTYDENLLGYISREYLSWSWMMAYLLFKTGKSSVDIINLTTHTIPHDQLLQNPEPETIKPFGRNLITLNTMVQSHQGHLIYAPMAYCSQKAKFYKPELIKEFNEYGKKVAREQGISTVETHSLLAEHQDWFKDIVHLHPEGNKFKAREYSKKIAELYHSQPLEP